MKEEMHYTMETEAIFLQDLAPKDDATSDAIGRRQEEGRSAEMEEA